MTQARVQLPDDVYCVESSRGVLFLTQRGTVEITGASVYQWFNRIAPYLDGSYSLAELTARLPEERRDFAEKLVTALLDRGIVRETRPGEERGVDAVVAVVGAGPLRPAVVRAFGLAGVQVVSEPRPDDLPRLLEAADLVVHVTGRPAVAETEAVERVCRDAKLPLAQLASGGNEAWLCPAGSTPGWRRLAGGPATWAGDAPAEPSPAAAVVVAGQVVQDTVDYLTGTRSAGPAGRMVRIGLDNLRSDMHRFLPHPFGVRAGAGAQSAADFMAGLAELENAPRLSEEQFSRRAAGCVDSRTGVLGEITEGDFAQLPLHVATAAVADPARLLGPGVPAPLVTGMGPDFGTARYETALRGLAAYASLMLDPRLLLDSSGRALLAPGDDPADALRALCSGELAGYLWANEPATGRAMLIGAGEVFPVLCDRSVPYRPPCGVAAGYSWAEAVGAALVQHCARLTIAEAAASGQDVPGRTEPPIDLQTAPLDRVAVNYLALLEAIGEPFGLHDVTGSLGVPAFAGTMSGKTVAYGCAASTGDALRHGLMQLLAHHQARSNGQPEYAPPEVPGIRFGPPDEGATAVPRSRSLGVRDLVASLRATGHAPAVLPLNHDRSLGAIMPYIARVVTRDE
jgi:hypothetical protein